MLSDLSVPSPDSPFPPQTHYYELNSKDCFIFVTVLQRSEHFRPEWYVSFVTAFQLS